MPRSLLFLPLLAAAPLATLAVACGSRTPLPLLDESGSDAASHDGPDAGSIDATDAPVHDAATRDVARKRCTNAGPLDGWFEVDVNLGGDYERLVSSAAWEGSDIWLATGGRAIENGATRLLRVEVKDGVPRVAESAPLANTEGWEPLALAVSDGKFALAARASGGESKLAVFARDGTLVHQTPIAPLEIDLRFRMEADVAWAGGDVVVAARRFGTPDHFVVERRDPTLAVRWSVPLASTAFRLRPDGSKLRTTPTLYAITATELGVEPGQVSPLSPMGAARSAWVGIDPTSFVLERDGAPVVHGKWPGQSFASFGYIPVYESSVGILITGNVDLGAQIGLWGAGGANALQWIAVPRQGGGGVPFADANDVGLFMLGIEIPHPEQPLRYWGCMK